MNNGSANLPAMHIIEAPSHLLGTPAAVHCFFAATVTSIPDLSSYAEFEHVDRLDQIRRVLDTQRLLLIGLAQQQPRSGRARAIDLRYIFHPNQAARQITIALVGKGVGATDKEAREEAQALWLEMNALFPRHLYRSGLLAVSAPEQLQYLLHPISNEPEGRGQCVISVRKRVEMTKLLRFRGQHPVAYPLRWGLSTLREFCKTMLQANQACMLSSAIAPTVLTPTERQALNTLAGQLRRMGEGRERSRRIGEASSLASGERQVQIQSHAGQERESFLPDPQAQINGEIYEQSLRQLGHALLWRCYVVGLGSLPHSVAGAFITEVVGASQPAPVSNEPTPTAYLPESVSLLGEERKRALTNLANLEFMPHTQVWECEESSDLARSYNQLTRLPNLIDVQEASCVFKLPCLPNRDDVGVALHSGAFVSQNPAAGKQDDMLVLGQGDDQAVWSVALNDLTRHTLVAGTTGSGKTTTCLHILEGLLRSPRNIPFLVIEPVNAEHNDYRALLNLQGTPRINLFTLGDEEIAPFRLNPFAMAPGISTDEHIAALMTCFKAALPMWEPLPRIFLKALRRTYYRAGWGPSRKANGSDNTRFPTIYNFYAELCRVVDTEIEHGGEARDNIRGATKLRIEALIESSCGRILATHASLPAEIWLEQPTILELRHIGDDEDRALMSAFILLSLREHCESTRKRQGGLQHITLIEEAHRLLGQAPEGASAEVSSIKGQAAAAFAQMLAETRKYGEGLIIAEQLPTKLVPDVLGNTGLKLMHRLTAKEDREVMGRSMRFTPFQEDHVAALGLGQAALFATTMEAPVLITMNGRHWDRLREDAPTDQEVKSLMQPIYAAHPHSLLPFAGCGDCPAPCRLCRDDGEALANDRSRGYEVRIKALVEAYADSGDPDQFLDQLVILSERFVAEQLPAQLSADWATKQVGVAYCTFVHFKARNNLFKNTHGLAWETFFRKAQQRRGSR